MSSGDRIRVSGHVKQSRRGTIIKTHDGLVWALEADDVIDLPSQGNATVEGVKIGFDRIKVDWCQPPD